MCHHTIHHFRPYRALMPELMRALDVVGSDIINFECPRCGAHDRERHLLLYLQATGILDNMRGKAVLHFAPERMLWHHFNKAGLAHYVRCDLYPQTSGVQRVDMLEMPFEDQSADFVIASHVLEHVADDIKALTEIRRVLKIGGYGILQTPFSNKLLNTWQDPGIDTDEARLQAYGQRDHVRLFGRDIFKRITDVGFESHVQTHRDILPSVNPQTVGVNEREPFFLFRKTNSSQTHS